MRIKHSKLTASVSTGLTYWYLFKHGLGPGTMPKGVNVLKVIEDGWKDYVLLDKLLTTEELNEYEIKEATPPDDLLRANGYNDISETYTEATRGCIECAEDVRMADGSASNYQSFMTWYDSLSNYQRIGVDDYADENDYPDYEDCTFGMLSKIMREFETNEQDDEWALPKDTFHVAAFGNDYDELQSSYDFKNPKEAITMWVQLQQKWPLNVMITGFQRQEEELRKFVVDHQDWYRQLSTKFKCPYDPNYIISECQKPVRPWTGKYAEKYPDQCHPFGLG